MELKQLLLLLPCHSLEDFPTHFRDQDALDLLLAWTTLWHPGLLVASGKMPSWNRCEQPPDDCDGHAILIPQVSRNRLPSGFLARCEEQGGYCLESSGDRDRDAATLLEQFQAGTDGAAKVNWEAEVVQDFYALSYTYLQIQLLTRQLRYSSNLDEVHFEMQLLKAAQAAAQQDSAQLELALDRCYDVLSEERHRYYPMDSYLVDLTLLAPTTLGSRFRQQLESEQPHNYLVDQTLLQQLEQQDAGLFAYLQQRHSEGKVHFVGGGKFDSPTGLLSYQTLVQQAKDSQDYFESRFGEPLRIYARRSPGIEQTLPSVLTRVGYHAALHEVFDEGKLYSTNSTNFRWEGPDGQFVNSLTKTVLDAEQPHTFLRLGIQVGEALDVDHLAVMQLVHWPGQVSPIYRDLVRSASRSDALGKWATLEEVFAIVHEPGYGESVNSTDYNAPYLKQLKQHGEQSPFDVARDLLKAEASSRRVKNLAAMAQLASGKKADATLNALAVESLASESAEKENLEQQVLNSVRGKLTGTGDQGLLLLNPASQPQRVLLSPEELKGRTLDQVPDDQVYHVARGLTGSWAVVDVPAMGYLHLAAGKLHSQKSATRNPGKVLVKQTTMRNEFLEVTVDTDTGSLRSIHNYEQRSNLCSLQLAWFDADLKKLVAASLKKTSSGDWRENLAQLWNRKSDPLEKQLTLHHGGYTKMVAESVKTIYNNSAVAEIRSQGTLCIRKKVVADFLVDYRLVRGSRYVEVRAQVTPRMDHQDIKIKKERVYQFPPESESNPSGYRQYFCWRLAHAQPSADQFRDLNSLRRRAPGGRFVAPYLVEWSAAHRLTWQCQGQPFHRVPADGKLDTLIGQPGDALLHSHAAIGLGPSYSQNQTEASQLPVVRLSCGDLKSGLPSAAWLYHCSSRHVSLIDWENLYADGQLKGFRLRLLETNGKQRTFHIETTLPIVSATSQGNDPNYHSTCQVDGNQVRLEIGAFEMLEIELSV